MKAQSRQKMEGVMELDDATIGDLVTRLRLGDVTAKRSIFLYLTDRFRPLAHRLLRVEYPRVGLYAETDDVLHDMIVKLIPYIERAEEFTIPTIGKFYSLVAMVLRNGLVDLARKHFVKFQSHELDESKLAAHPKLQQKSGLHDWRERLRIHELVARLPDAERAVLEMWLYLDYGTGRIAEILDVHPGTISRRLASGKERLGRLLKGDNRGNALGEETI
jgi:RNA polymerase sigma factor (sigma-70 family)